MKHSQEVTTVSLESIEQFRSWLCGRGKSVNTAKAYSTDLRMFLQAVSPTSDPVPMEEFDELAASWLTRDRYKAAQKTTGRRLTSLRAFAKWAGWGEVLDDYDAPKPARSLPHPLPEGMEGVRRLIQLAPTDAQKTLIALCGMCGCRVGEALDITTECFDLERMNLTIRGKGDKTRVVPIATEAWEIMAVQVVRSYQSGKTVCDLRDRHARKIITNLGRKARFRRSISSHDLRATFGTHVYDKTKDIRVVQELLGHSTSAQTELYIGVKDDALRKAVEL
jgi:site-specific recombinase XerD